MEELIDDLEVAICSLLEEKNIARQQITELQEQLAQRTKQLEQLESDFHLLRLRHLRHRKG